jgi:Rap1a immunity proteins
MGVLVLVAALAATPSVPEELQGQTFVRACEAYARGEAPAGAVCLVYVQGFSDANGVAGNRLFCTPPDASYAKEVDVVLKWLWVHPWRLHEHRAALVEAALREAYPCEPPAPAAAAPSGSPSPRANRVESRAGGHP